MKFELKIEKLNYPNTPPVIHLTIRFRLFYISRKFYKILKIVKNDLEFGYLAVLRGISEYQKVF